MFNTRVLIVENKPAWQNAHANTVRGLGYEPIIVCKGRTDVPISELQVEAMALCRNQRCHVAVVDMRLWDDDEPEDTSGLDLVKKLIDCRRIIVSAYVTPDQANELRGSGIEVVTKQKSLEKLAGKLKEAAEAASASARQLCFQWPRGFQLSAMTSHMSCSEEDIEDVLAQLFPGASMLSLALLNDQDDESSLGDHPHSLVLRVEDHTSSGQPKKAIVKIARREKIEEEQKNYDTFVAQYIENFRSYANLQQTRYFYGIGGVKYSEVVDARSFRSYYRLAKGPEDWEHLVKIVSSYKDSWSLYILERTRSSLDELLVNTWDKAKKDRPSSTFSSRLEDAVLRSSDTYTHPWDEIARSYPFEYPLPNPVRWFESHRGRNKVATTPVSGTRIVHGDLWSENLWADPSGNAIVIDFEHTGPGWILQDFVRLEFDILTRLLRSGDEQEDWRIIHYLYVALVDREVFGDKPVREFGNDEVRKAFKVIAAIRQCAREKCIDRTRDGNHYLYALLCNCSYRAVFPKPSFTQGQAVTVTARGARERNWDLQRERSLLLGSLIARRLSHTDRWPNHLESPATLRNMLGDDTIHIWTDSVLQDICFTLGIDAENLRGNTPRAKMMNLYQACKSGISKVKPDQLLESLRKSVPGIPWMEE